MNRRKHHIRFIIGAHRNNIGGCGKHHRRGQHDQRRAILMVGEQHIHDAKANRRTNQGKETFQPSADAALLRWNEIGQCRLKASGRNIGEKLHAQIRSGDDG